MVKYDTCGEWWLGFVNFLVRRYEPQSQVTARIRGLTPQLWLVYTGDPSPRLPRRYMK